MDLLAELGLVPLPAAPVAGGASSASAAPASVEPGAFAAHMEETPKTRPPEPAQAARTSGQGHPAGAQQIALDTGALATLPHHAVAPGPEQSQAFTATTWGPDGGPAVFDPADSALPTTPAPADQTVEPEAAPHRRQVPLLAGDPTRVRAPGPTVAGATTFNSVQGEPAAVAMPPGVEGQTKGRPEAREPEASMRESEPESDRPTWQGALDPLPAKAAPDAPIADADEHEPAPAPSSEPATAAAPGSTDGEEATSPAGTDLRRDPLQSLHQASGPDAASGASSGAGAPASLAGGDARAPSGRSGPLPGAEQIGRTGGPRNVLGIGARAEVRGELPPQEKVTAPDAQIEPEARAPDDAAPKQQTASTPQIGRLPHFSGSTGNGAAVPHPAIVTPGDLGQAVVRPPDGVTVGPGPYPATEQVALQINKALDESRTEIRIRLDPPELGEVDVHLEFRELRLTATVSAERPDTLDLLQRDARTLARALRDAGVELADADLSFAHNGRGDRPDAGAYAQRAIGLPRALAAPAPLQDLSRALRGAGGFVSLSEGRMDLRV